MKQYKLLIFDLDGTLLDTIEGIGTAMNHVLEKHRFPTHPMDSYYSFVGKGLKQLARLALPETVTELDLETYYQELLVSYEKYYDTGLKMYEGLAQVLNDLKKEGYHFAMNTNKIDYITQEIVKKYLKNWEWKVVIGAVEGKYHKPNPSGVEEILRQTSFSKEESIYIGDSEVDILTAKNAGIDVIYVPWGFRQGKEIVGEEYFKVKSVEELKEFLMNSFNTK